MKHICISTKPARLQRWQQAFPHGRILDSLAAETVPGHDSAIFWLHLDGLNKQQFDEALTLLNHEQADPKVIVMTAMPDADGALKYFQLGVVGYCHAFSAPHLFEQIAIVISQGGLWLGRDFKQRLTSALGRLELSNRQPLTMSKLSAREQDVARHVAAGLSNREIAD
ncbi:MAG: hypothetical protein C0622_04955, partial [Desulfuromonas sp.]